MEKKLISNKALVFRIVSIVLIFSVISLFISTEYLKKTAIDTLASDDAKKTAQLVFETMNTRMQEGWTKSDLDSIIGRLEVIRKDMSISSYRSPRVEELFGIVQRDKKIVDSDPLIQKAMKGEEIFIVDDETGVVRFLYPMKTNTECAICHINTKEGDINGVLDITFPHSDIKISLDTMSIYFIIFFILFLIIFSILFFAIINKKMVTPILELTKEIEDVEQEKDLTKRANIHTDIKELERLQNSFNKLLSTIKYYYDKLIDNLYTDELTSLPNLAKLQKDIDIKDDTHSLAIFDIKSFGKINRVYGVKIADMLLKSFAKEVKALLSNNGELYRLYGAEFVVIFNNKLTYEELKKYLENIRLFKFTYNNVDFTLDITLGYVDTFDSNVLENGIISLKSAKQDNKNILIFNDTLSIKYEDANHIKWLKKLDDAIKEDRVVPFFMPMKNTNTQKIDKYEALVRIIDGDNIYTPDKFVDIAHASGKYPIVTQTMIIKTFEYFKDISDIQFSINFALSDILNEQTTQVLFDNLKAYKYSKNVIIELLETEEISDFVLLNKFIREVKKYDASIAIDDFGSGYSNFNYILNLDIDIIKLDSCLVQNIFTDQNSAVIISNVVKIVKELGLKVVAERVESQDIENILTIHEVDYLQGFHIGKPASEILKDEN